MRRRAPEATERFEEWGINGHVRNKGPGAEAVRYCAMAVCRKEPAGVLISREQEDRETHWRTGRASANLPILGEKHRGADSTRR